MNRDEIKRRIKGLLAPFITDEQKLVFSSLKNPSCDAFLKMAGFQNTTDDSKPAGEKGWFDIQVDETRLPFLLSEAEANADAFEAVQYLLARHHALEKEMPSALREQERKIVMGEVKKPRRHGASRAKNYWRDLYAALIVSVLHDQLRIDVGKSDRRTNERDDSACDIVAEVFCELGVPISYDVVRSVYYRQRERVKN